MGKFMKQNVMIYGIKWFLEVNKDSTKAFYLLPFIYEA